MQPFYWLLSVRVAYTLNKYYINVAANIGPSDMLSQGETMNEINRVHGINHSVQSIKNKP